MKIYNIYRKQNILKNVFFIIFSILFVVALSYVYYTARNDIIAVIMYSPIIYLAITFNSFLDLTVYFLNLKKIKQHSSSGIEVYLFNFSKDKLHILDNSKNEISYNYSDIADIYFDIDVRDTLLFTGFLGVRTNATFINFIKIELHINNNTYYLYFCRKTLHGNLKVLFKIIDLCKATSKISYFPSSGMTYPEMHRLLNSYIKNNDKRMLTNRLITIFKDIIRFIFIIFVGVLLFYLLIFLICYFNVV